MIDSQGLFSWVRVEDCWLDHLQPVHLPFPDHVVVQIQVRHDTRDDIHLLVRPALAHYMGDHDILHLACFHCPRLRLAHHCLMSTSGLL